MITFEFVVIDIIYLSANHKANHTEIYPNHNYCKACESSVNAEAVKIINID